jgi:peptidoglycan/xylan/chitin deacetylase (PgdA/CDA1 family)
MANARVAYFLIATLIFLGAVACYALAVDLVKYKVHEYPGLAGPAERTLVAPRAPTPWKAYESGSPSRLAVLLTDPDSSWLGLAHALKSFGVPFRVTTDVSEALRHKVVLVYPMVSGRVLSGPELKAIAAHPREGGHLIGVNVLGGGLNEVFGFAEATESRSRFLMKFDPATSPLLSEFSREMEQTISLGDPRRHGEIVGTLGYSGAREEPLAVYEDGSAAITWRSYGEGRTYAFGFDIGDFFFRAHHARHYAAHRSYVNAFEPTADVVARLIRNIYLQGNPDAVLVGTVPEGRRLSVMFTYDVDGDSSYGHMVAYAELLRAAGIRGTFNIQTKYVRDFNDAVLFDAAAVRHLQALARLGMEIASHTVAHSRQFAAFPLGRGDESYPDNYRPVVLDRRVTRSGTILGELRVSKYLLENLGATGPVVSFRPGYLAYPNQLPQALAASGYRFSSSMTANKALTHLPFQLNYDREARQEVDVFEIPVTVEDEKSPEMGSRVDDAVALAREISRYGGSFVVLTHPDMLGHKLEFHKAFIAAVQDWAWFGSISDFGNWWAARNAVEVDSHCLQAVCTISLHAPQPIQGLALRFPRDCEYQESPNSDIAVRPTDGGVVLGRIQGNLTLRCARPRNAADATP